MPPPSNLYPNYSAFGKPQFVDCRGIQFKIVPLDNPLRVQMVQSGHVSQTHPLFSAVYAPPPLPIAQIGQDGDDPSETPSRQIQKNPENDTEPVTPNSSPPAAQATTPARPQRVRRPRPSEPQDKPDVAPEPPDMVTPPQSPRPIAPVTPAKPVRPPPPPASVPVPAVIVRPAPVAPLRFVPPPVSMETRASTQLLWFRVPRVHINKAARMRTSTAILAEAERLRSRIPLPGDVLDLMDLTSMTHSYGRVERVLVKQQGGARGPAHTGAVVVRGFVKTRWPVDDPAIYCEYDE